MSQFGPSIDQFKSGERIADVPVSVIEATRHVARTERPFARYQFKDRSGTVPGIRWDYELRDEEKGAVALLTGEVQEYQQALQIKVSELRVLTDPAQPVLDRVVEPTDRALMDRLETVLRGAEASLPPLFWRIFVDSLGGDPFDREGPFWTYAAAQSRHHAGRGGLAWHVLTMLAHVEPMARHYPGLDVPLLQLAVLCHDLGKLDCYKMNLASAERLPLDAKVGHTAYSLARCHAAITRLRADGGELARADEENLLHCIAAHHGRPEWGAPCEPQTAEAHALHALDMLDSQIRGGLDKAGPRQTPDRGAAPADDQPDDPFTADEDDPFADAEPVDGVQKSLF